MGLHITGTLLPRDITKKQWASAYEEALQLVDAYDFLDVIRNEKRFARYGLTWAYAEKSAERRIHGHLGVRMCGAFDG